MVQPLPGIGDMIWHLPHIRALAAAAGRPVTLVTKPGSRADQIFAAEPSVGGFVWLRGSTSGRRGAHHVVADLWRLTAALRGGRFDAIVLLHHSRSLAAVAWLAGIPRRHGYGFGTQRLFLRPPFLDAAMLPVHPYGQATAWLAAAGLVPAEAEPVLPVAPAAAAAVRARLGDMAGQVVAIGIGSSEPRKQWGAASFAELAGRLRDAGWRNLILVGGAAEADLAADIRSRFGGDLAAAIGWPLGELAALLAQAAFYVGNDTGAANMAAAVGTRSYCLFGATAPFDHSARIVPITPPGGAIDPANGMRRITPAAVFDAITTGQRPDRAPC